MWWSNLVATNQREKPKLQSFQIDSSIDLSTKLIKLEPILVGHRMVDIIEPVIQQFQVLLVHLLTALQFVECQTLQVEGSDLWFDLRGDVRFDHFSFLNW